MKFYYGFRFVLLLIFGLIFYSILTSFHHNMKQTTIPNIKEHETITYQIKPAVKLYYTVLIDPLFSSTEVKIIREALNEWQYTTNGIVMFRPVMGYNATELKRMENDTVYKTIAIKPAKGSDTIIALIDAVLDQGIVGYTDNTNLTHQRQETIYMVGERIDSEAEYNSVLLHELFHIMGAFHLDDEGTLMRPDEETSAMCITTLDVKYFCYLYGCDSEEMRPCYNARHPLICSDETFHQLH